MYVSTYVHIYIDLEVYYWGVTDAFMEDKKPHYQPFANCRTTRPDGVIQSKTRLTNRGQFVVLFRVS